MNVMDSKRATLNKCDLTKNHDDINFSILNLNSIRFDELMNNLKDAEGCKICYNKDIFTAQNLNRKFTILSNNI
jgi:hypothetical protein